MSSPAVLLTVGAAASWSLSQVLTKEGLRRMDFVAYGVVRPLFALPLVLSYGFITSGLRFPGPELVGIAACGGLIDSFLGTLLYMLSLRRSPAHQAAPLSSTAPFWGVVTAVLFLGERPHPIVFVSALLVVLGAYFLGGHRPGETTSHPALGTLAALGAGVMWGGGGDAPSQILPHPWDDAHHLPADHGGHRRPELGTFGRLAKAKAPLVPQGPGDSLPERVHRLLPRLAPLAFRPLPRSGQRARTGSRLDDRVLLPAEHLPPA